jgi:putative transposase
LCGQPILGAVAPSVRTLEAAEQRCRAVNGPHLVALVRAGARFEKGKLVERTKEVPEEDINEVAA